MPASAARLVLLAILLAATASTLPASTLRVGVHDKPPFAIKESDGSWHGLSVALWRNVANSANIDFEFVETPYEDLLADISKGKIDVAVGEVPVRPTSLPGVEFTQPFLISSIGVAMPDIPLEYAWRSLAREFMDWTVGRVLLGIFAALALVSMILWIIERHHGHGHFHGGLRGFGSALWFSAVTMTTVGYGDKTPVTFPGRLLTFFWMLSGVLLVSIFTATATSRMAAARISTSISHIHDLNKFVCGALKGSESEQILHELGLRTLPFESLEEALAQMSNDRLKAVVADKNSLLYLRKTLAATDPSLDFDVLDIAVRQTFIAIPHRENLPESQQINHALVAFINSNEWVMLQNEWLGSRGLIP